ncbi:MAG: hypothetical protein R3A51_15785 [Nannocystaceae bacterium]
MGAPLTRDRARLIDDFARRRSMISSVANRQFRPSSIDDFERP